jgi:anthranilate phosphoribosyltransferase
MSVISLSSTLHRLIERQNLSAEEMLVLMRQIMSDQVPPVMLGALLTALHAKGETIEEITAAAQVMREVAVPVQVPDTTHLLDIVGTGGDGAHTFNISTCSMFVAAAAGARISKHGNRSVSSKSGSADVLEALGVRLDLSADAVAESIKRSGIGFMFAPLHHPAMKNVAPVRRELGVRTLFNVLGPLTNPAGAPHILMGVFRTDWVRPLAQVLQNLGATHALVVHGQDGLDEVSLSAPTRVAQAWEGQITEFEITPEQFGFQRVSSNALKVASPEESKARLLSVLNNEPSPARDIVVLNAGCALYTAQVATTIEEGIARAHAVLDNGQALQHLTHFVQTTQQLAGTPS